MSYTVSVEKVGNEIFFKTAPVFQYNVGEQYLKLIGFDLAGSYRVDFSNYIDSQDSVSVIGGADGAVIPNDLLATGSTVYAFYVEAEADATTTLYRIEIPVIKRPEPSDREPSPEEQSAISQLMAEVGDLSELTTTDKDNLVDAINEVAQGGGITVDSAMSSSSTNPVQNKVIKDALDDLKADIAQSASIDSGGLISFKNDDNTTVFTLQLPIYNGGVG
jgi:hypothetical protein